LKSENRHLSFFRQHGGSYGDLYNSFQTIFMRSAFTLLSFLLLNVSVRAQSSSRITGKLNDEAGRAVSGASVSLLRAKDSVLVKIALTDKEGRYEFLNMKEGSYLLFATSVGYKKVFSAAIENTGSDLEVPGLTITQTSKDLGGVTVTAQRPFVETKLDKTIVNVDASPTSAGSTALEILEKSPGIMVDNDGNISLRGKQGVIIMMDGKQTYLSPADLANMLKNMPASALDQIEIMTNPSSKYDASGNSGIINIKTKKGRNDGLNGNIMLGATLSLYRLHGQSYYLPKSQNSFNFNYKKGKVNFFGNYNPNYFKGRGTLVFENRFLDANENITGYNNTESRFRFRNFNHTLKLGFDWNANKKNVFGMVLNGFAFNGHPTPVTEASLTDEDRVLSERLISNTVNEISFKNGSVNLNWKHNFDTTGKELTMDFDYVTYSNVSDIFLTTDRFNGALEFQNRSALRGRLPADINIYTFKSDYTHPFKGGKIEAGVKISYVKNDNLVNYENLVGGKWEPDNNRSNHFIYDENINAAYMNYNRQVKKWTLQAGLRVENSIAHGNQVVTNQKFKRDSTNLFPTAFASYAASKKHTFTFSYGRRITRPNYQDLNPFVYFLDTLSYRQGNIYLKPQYTHNFEISHSFLGKYITTINFNTTDNVISQLIRQKENSKIQFLTVDNVARFDNMGLSITAPISFAKWWNTNLFTNIYNNHYVGVFDNTDINLRFTSFMVNLTNNFTIAKGFTAELSGFYRHKSLNGLTRMEPIYQMSLGLQKQVMKGAGTLRLNIRDPFGWQQFKGLNQYGKVDANFHFRPDTRQVTTTFTWRFGGNGQNNQPRRRSSSSQDEQSRVGGAGQQ
jgi:outer membrane cobalamin receptor